MEIHVPNDTLRVDSLLSLSRSTFTSAPEKSIIFAQEALSTARKIIYRKGEAIALKNIGIVHYYQSQHVEALDYYNQSLEVYRQMKDNSGMANLQSNIGVVYFERGDNAKALENYLESLKSSELAGDKFRILIALNNVSGVYTLKNSTADKALEYYLKALALSEELGKTEEAAVICVNLGSIFYDKHDDVKSLYYYNKALEAYGDAEFSLHAYNGLGNLYRRQKKYDQALKNHHLALTLANTLNIKLSIGQSFAGLAQVYVDHGDYNNAFYYYNQAEQVLKEIEAKPELKDLYEKVAVAYAQNKEYKKAYDYQTLFNAVKDTLYNEDTDKKLGTLQFDFDLQKKQTEINLLTKDKALTDQKLDRQRLAKTASLTGLGLVMMIALLLYRSYRNKIKTNKLLDRQKAEIEQLLLNILPEEVAKELQLNGHAIPRNYESVAVLFTDIQGFSSIAQKMTPQELVQELNTCFMAFDEIIEKHNLEKIKTIGDAYMCAAGIPTPDPKYMENIIDASLEIRDFMRGYNANKKRMGAEPWELRLGVHVGPMVAGVVGKKKYAYDVWGMTVNIASRMESNGLPGQVNVSSTVYQMIREKYNCTHRGKIYAKNMGDIDMYIVEGQKVKPIYESAALLN